MPMPLVCRGLLYNCRDSSVLHVYDAKSGKKRYRMRLGEGRTGFTASPVAGDVFELGATNSLGEICMATPTISQGVIFCRARHHLIAVDRADRPAAP
ncbi:MAG: hypothetical protein ACE5E5_14800 [Phycisphaerae bacterium]